MTDSQQLLLVVVAIYLSECAVWTSLYSIALLGGSGGSWRWSQPGKWFGNRSNGLLFKPLLPAGTVYLCQLWPLSLSPRGVVSEVFHAPNLTFRPDQPRRYVPWDELRTAQAVEHELHINGRLFCRTGSAKLARHLADLIRTCRPLPAEQRAGAILQAVLTGLDGDAIRQRLEEFERQRPAVRAVAVATFALVFVVCPTVVWQFGWTPAWPFLLAALMLCVMLAALLFRRAHRVLYPDDAYHRRLHTALMLLNPLAAIRAQDPLSRELLSLFHPLAVAQVLCDPPRYREFARQILLDARYPLRPLCDDLPPEAAEVEAWFRQRSLAALEAFLRLTGVAVEELQRSEQPLNETCRTYCPRCRCQYVLDAGECAACGGIPLLPFATPAAHPPLPHLSPLSPANK